MDVVVGWSGVCEGLSGGPRPAAPGIPRVLASLARAPFAGSERGGTWWWRGPLLRRPGHPPLVSLCSLAPPYAEAKGAGCCTPLSCGRKGRERSERGMRGEGRGAAWSDGVGWCDSGPRLLPGHTPRACCARTRPFRWERKGQDVVAVGVLPRRPGHTPLAALAPPYAGAKGAMDGRSVR